MPIVVTLLRFTVVKFVHNPKTSRGRIMNRLDNVIVLNPVLINAPCPMDVTFDKLSVPVSPIHPLNDFSPMDVTFDKLSVPVSPTHPSNACEPIEVILDKLIVPVIVLLSRNALDMISVTCKPEYMDATTPLLIGPIDPVRVA